MLGRGVAAHRVRELAGRELPHPLVVVHVRQQLVDRLARFRFPFGADLLEANPGSVEDAQHLPDRFFGPR